MITLTAAWLSFFACWTVLTHAVVFAGADFDALVRWSWLVPLASIALAAVLAHRRSSSQAKTASSAASAFDRGDPSTTPPSTQSAFDGAASNGATPASRPRSENARCVAAKEDGEPSSFSDDRLRILSSVLSLACVIVGITTRYEIFWWSSLFALSLSLRPRASSAATTRDLEASTPRHAVLALVALALLITAITACAHRPNIDDAGYVNLAVGALDHPDWPLLRYDTLHGIDGLGILLPTYRVHSFEVFGAWISRLVDADPLRVFHLYLPFVFAPLSVATFALLYRSLVPKRWLTATWITLLLLLVLGQKPVAYGNFAYVRLFQGKALLATVAIPLVVWCALRWQREGSARSWAWLLVAHIVAVGITANAMYVAPLASGLLLAASWRPELAATKRLVLGLLASSYPLLLALHFVLTHQVSGSIERQESRLLAADLTGVVGTGWQRAILFAGLVCAGSAASRASARQFWTRYAWLVLLLPLNPYIAELWARYVTGRFNWRLLWAVAMVPMAALVIVETCARLPRWAVATFAFLAIGLVAWSWDDTTLSRENGVEWRAPSLKVERDDYALAQEIVETADGGTVLAPESIASWIVTFRHHPFPLVVRPHYLTYMIGKVPGRELKERRELYEYATGESRDATSAQTFAAALRERRITAVAVPTKEFAWKSELEDSLEKAGYVKTRRPHADLWRKDANPRER